jgi:membrane-associated phospholipid phosphatase
MLRHEVYEWGLSVIHAVQHTSSPALDAAMKTLTHIGNPAAALAVILFIYWCVDTKKGFALFFLTFIAFALNVCLKNIFRVPRPFALDPSVALTAAAGFSTPSGHAQGAAAFWTLFARICLPGRKKTGIALALCVPFAVSFTRVYLGVHYPSDVLLGLITGYLCALGGILFYDSASAKIAPFRKSVKALLAALLCIAFNQFSDGDVAASAALFGFTLGYIAVAHNGCAFSIKRAAATYVFCWFFCGATYFILKFALGLLQLPPAYTPLIRFVHYAAVGFMASVSPLRPRG